MSAPQAIHSAPSADVAEMLAAYRRLATMDPPALRSLVVDLQRMSDESSASALLQPAPRTHARARRAAQRAAAAQAALASDQSVTLSQKNR